MEILYGHLRAYLTGLGPDVYVKPTNSYQGFWRRAGSEDRVFAYVHVRRGSIDIDVRPALAPRPGLVAPVNGKMCRTRISVRDANDLAAVRGELQASYREG